MIFLPWLRRQSRKFTKKQLQEFTRQMEESQKNFDFSRAYPSRSQIMNEFNYDPLDILNLPLEDNDAGASTIREYLVALLIVLWTQSEDFRSNKPFGNTDWDRYIISSLIKNGYVKGKVGEDGYVDEVDAATADHLIIMAIEYLGKNNG